jgi:hypothetical protein
MGFDGRSGTNFDHRKRWIEDRLKNLAASFGMAKVWAGKPQSTRFPDINSFLRFRPVGPSKSQRVLYKRLHSNFQSCCCASLTVPTRQAWGISNPAGFVRRFVQVFRLELLTPVRYLPLSSLRGEESNIKRCGYHESI